MSAPERPPNLVISSAPANEWWRTHDVVGAILNRLILALIATPIVLAYKEQFLASAIVFAFLVPYAVLVRYLAVVAVKRRIANDPSSLSEFRDAGILRD